MASARFPVTRFVGGSNVLRAPTISNERTINFYPESTLGFGGKGDRWLKPSEGLRAHAQVTDSNTRVLFYQDGHLYFLCGQSFGEVLDGGTTVFLGTVEESELNPGSMCSNGTAGHQVMIVSAGFVYIWDTDSEVFSHIDMGDSEGHILMGEFMDGYFFALVADSRQVRFSALEDGTTWDPLDIFERSWGSDNISFIKRAGRQIWLVGTKTSEVWADNGGALLPFAPIQGVFLDMGSIAPWSGQRDGQTLIWLSQDERGGGLVVRATGYTPQEISTYAVDLRIQGQARPANDETTGMGRSEAFVMQIDGHVFYWIQVPGLDTTPVFDLVEKEWHERAMWVANEAVWIPHLARCHAFAFERHFVGVRTSGVIYEMSPAFLDDGILE